MMPRYWWSDSEDEPGSGEAALNKSTPTGNGLVKQPEPKQLFSGKERRGVLADQSNSRNDADQDTQTLILMELKKTNSRLDDMASDFTNRLDDVEGQVKLVQEQQKEQQKEVLSSSCSSSAEKTKRKIPAHVRVSSKYVLAR